MGDVILSFRTDQKYGQFIAANLVGVSNVIKGYCNILVPKMRLVREREAPLSFFLVVTPNEEEVAEDLIRNDLLEILGSMDWLSQMTNAQVKDPGFVLPAQTIEVVPSY
jgi:hypothetical protein